MTTVEDFNSYRLQYQLTVPKNIDKHFKLLNFVGVGAGLFLLVLLVKLSPV